MNDDARATGEPSAASVAELLAAFRSGDRAAQATLLVRFQPWLRLLARLEVDSRLNAKADPSDIVQQTLLEAHRALPQFRGTTEPELAAWLRRILAHVLAHELRQHRGTQKRDASREVSLDESLAGSSQRLGNLLAASITSPSLRAERHEQEMQLADALARLPADYREVLILRHLEDLPHDEIARRMNRSTGATRMLWVRALARLREEVEE